MLKNELSIGQVASRTGLSVSALRYYEAEGLIHAQRNSGGQRRFARAQIRRISFVMAAQRFGFSIARIRTLLNQLPNGRTPTQEDWAMMAKDFRAELDARISALETLRDNLDGCIGCGCLSLRSCKLYNKNDEAAEEGTGPRVLRGVSA